MLSYPPMMGGMLFPDLKVNLKEVSLQRELETPGPERLGRCGSDSSTISLYGILKLKNVVGGCVFRAIEEEGFPVGALLTYALIPEFTEEYISVLGKIEAG